MIQHEYKNHIIQATAVCNDDTDAWSPRLIIHFELPDGSLHDKGILFTQTFLTKEAARDHALLYAIHWIDRGKPELPGGRAD